MNNLEEISAFAAFSAKKAKKINLDKKSKLKVKKKKKNAGSVISVVDTLIKATNSVEPINVNETKKKHIKKKKLIKSILDAQKDSIFKNCTVTNKVDNIFLEKNGLPSNDVGVEALEKNLIKVNQSKKHKKQKLTNGDDFQHFKNNIENEENSVLLKTGESETECALKEMNIKFPKRVEKSSLKELKKKTRLPNLIYSDSVKVGEEVFSWLLSPLSMKEFFKNCWEQKPLHIQHNNKNYFKCICTFHDFKVALREHDLFFTRNIDVTSYIDGERKTENPIGKAKPSMVWDFYNSGKSIRLLNPQTFIPNIRSLNTALQEFFHCFVGANIYLTPPGTQGFAPHYDDIEAFVLQLDGEKHWKLYNPRSPEDVLPRESSRNFREDEIGEPILEVTLQPGDLLYFPRGVIHQANCLPHTHSLHITVSCYQKNSWADLLEKVLPVALQRAISEDVELRKGLPIGYLNSLGMVYSDQESPLREKFIQKFEELAKKVINYCPVDAGVDQLGANFTHDALPPSLTEVEKLYGADRNFTVENMNVFNALKNSGKNLSVKLVRATSVRLVSEQEEMVLYYTTDNSLVYHEHEVSSTIISSQWAQGVEFLIHSYPKFVEMKLLPISNKVAKPGKWKRIVEFVYFLWQKGLLLFDQPFTQICA